MEKTLNSIPDYTNTHRVVLLLDLNPLLHSPSSSSYIAYLLSAVKPLVTFPPLSSSLFSFKLFFSSLSPLLSSSKLPFPSSSSLSFDTPTSTYCSLSKILLDPSFASSIGPNVGGSNTTSSSASHLAASMRQLLHGYAWDLDPSSIDGTPSSNCDLGCVRSNLVVLFSPMGVELNGEFRGLFESVNDAFVARDIHLGWIDVRCGELGGLGVEELGSGGFESGIRDLGWGFCSSDTVVLGSAVVPFRLIYPRIGMSPNAIVDLRSSKTIPARLSLEILDAKGNPFDCKCCDLELAGSISVFMDAELAGHEQKRSICEEFGDGNANLHIKAVQIYSKDVEMSDYLRDPILVSDRCEKEQNTSRGKEKFEEKILQMLEPEMFKSPPNKSGPIWQMLMSFLCREGYWGLVTLSNGNGCSLTGVLKPFTVSSALLWIKSGEFKEHGRPSVKVVKEMGAENIKSYVGSDLSHIGSSSGPLLSKPSEIRGFDDRKRKKKKRSLKMLQELTWSDFCKAALKHLQIDLEDIYFVRACNKSKKLKLLKCWMIEVTTYHSVTIAENDMLKHDVSKSDDRSNDLPSEGMQPVTSSASAGEDILTGASRVQDEVAIDYHSQTMESSLDDLPQKIQQGLESDDVDLGSLAERLVNSSVYWLYKKCENGTNAQDQTGEVKSEDASASTVVTELMTLLLKEPKDLAAKASSPSSADVTSERIVREYELQILFRMEILQSEIGASIKESVKQKFVKQICSSLESIQCRLEGGFFGDWSLDRYVEKILKSRYCESLGDVVRRIYERLDLLLFEDEDKSPNPFLSSDDGNQSLKERPETITDERKFNARINDSEHSTSQEIKQDDDHARRLIEAQERRQRARRFAAVTRWVWAPKQATSMKVKHVRKHSKRKGSRRGSYDMVCETPMTGKDGSLGKGVESRSNGKRNKAGGATPVCGSVSKALFQDY